MRRNPESTKAFLTMASDAPFLGNFFTPLGLLLDLEAVFAEDSKSRNICLEAKDAERHGAHIQYEDDNVMEDIGYWNSKNDFVTWQVAIARPGTYIIIIEQSCLTGNGGTYRITVGENILVANVVVTGSWINYVRLRVGEVSFLKEGKYQLKIEPTVFSGPSLMNVRRVVLVAK